MDQKRFVFISGLHKSGTTLLFKILRDHPEISGFRDTGVPRDEGQHLQSVYLPAKAFGGFGRFAFDHRAYLDENSPLATAQNASKLYAEWAPYWDPNAEVLLEKSPPNLVRTRFLQQLFPNSWFITILRHPIAVSYSTQRISKTPMFSLLEHWLTGNESFSRDKDKLRKVLVVRYEELAVAPQKVMDQIYAFIEVHGAQVNQDINNRNLDHYARWQALQRNFLGKRYARWLKDRFGARISRFGYDLDNLENLDSILY